MRTELLLPLGHHDFWCSFGLDRIAAVVVKKVGSGFPGTRGGKAWAGRDRDWVLSPWAGLVIHLVWQPGMNMKQVPLALKRSHAPTTLKSKCHPLHEGKGEREDGWRERTDNPGR